MKRAAHLAWFRHGVAVGLAAADAGRLVPHEDVEAELAGRRARTTARLASAGGRRPDAP